MKTIRDLHLPELLSDLDAMVLVSNAADIVSPKTSAGGVGISRAPAAIGRNRAGDSVRRTHRLPPQSACSHAMSKLILGEAGSLVFFNDQHR